MRRGENTPKAKLTEAKVRAIKQLRITSPKISDRKIAELYSVSPQAIGQIFNGITWKHL